MCVCVSSTLIIRLLSDLSQALMDLGVGHHQGLLYQAGPLGKWSGPPSPGVQGSGEGRPSVAIVSTAGDPGQWVKWSFGGMGGF